MRIGLNGRYLRKQGTGIGQVTLETIRTLAILPEARVHTFIVYTEEPAVLDFTLPPNWRLLVIPTRYYRRDDLLREYLWERFTLPRAAKASGCQAFFSMSQSASQISHSIRHVMAVHDLAPLHFLEYRKTWRRKFFYRAVLRAIRSADALITPSESTAKDIVTQLSIDRTHLTVAPLGIPRHVSARPSAEHITDTLEKYQLTPGYLYHGGGLEKRKNTALLLEVYADLVKEGREVPPLVISGNIHAQKNPLATDVRKLVEQLGLEERVHLIGFVPDQDLAALYAGARIFLFPSLFEGFGFPILEAFATGTPVLTSETSSIPEVAGDAALLINPTSRESLRAGLMKLLSDPILCAQLSTRGKERTKYFSWEAFSKTALEILLQ